MTTYCLKDFENPATRDQALEYFKKNPREYFLSPALCRDEHNMRSMDDNYSKWVIKPSNVKQHLDTNRHYQFRNECQALELHDETEIQNIWNERLDKLDTECYKMLISKVTSDDFRFRGYDSTALKYLFIQMEEQQKRIDELENIISTLVHK